jgi:hypothetical protein
MNEFNRFDIVEAHYAFCSDYHEGQWSDKYAKLCRISQYFKPSPLFRGYKSLNSNSKSIYRDLVKKEKSSLVRNR